MNMLRHVLAQIKIKSCTVCCQMLQTLLLAMLTVTNKWTTNNLKWSASLKGHVCWMKLILYGIKDLEFKKSVLSFRSQFQRYSLSLIFGYEGSLWILSSLLHYTSVTCLHQPSDHIKAGRWCPTEGNVIRKLSYFFCFRLNHHWDRLEHKSSHFSVVLSEHWGHLVVLSGRSMFRLTFCWPQHAVSKKGIHVFSFISRNSFSLTSW